MGLLMSRKREGWWDREEGGKKISWQRESASSLSKARILALSVKLASVRDKPAAGGERR